MSKSTYFLETFKTLTELVFIITNASLLHSFIVTSTVCDPESQWKVKDQQTVTDIKKSVVFWFNIKAL